MDNIASSPPHNITDTHNLAAPAILGQQAGHADRIGNKRLSSLQSLRAVAAVLVLLHHVMQTPSSSILAHSLALRQILGPFGSAGVDLFFVTSGFVIAHSISANGDMLTTRFLAGRAIRVLPLFWLTSTVYTVQLWLSGADISPTALLNTITLIPLPGHGDYVYPVLYVGWSLGFELAFYGLASIFIQQPRRFRAPLLLLLLVGLAIAGALAGLSSGPLPFFVNGIMAEFALGVAAWILWTRRPDARLATPLIAAGVLLFASNLFVDIGQGFEPDPVKIIENITSVKRSLAWGIPSAIFLLGAAIRSSNRQSRTTLPARLGDASYSLYLIHPIILSGVEQTGVFAWVRNDFAFMALVVVLCVGISLLVHRHVEKPIIRWSKRAAGSGVHDHPCRTSAITKPV